MLFNAGVFGEWLYNEPVPGATLQGVGSWQCSAVYQAAGAAQLAGLGNVACAGVMDAVVGATLAGLGQLVASAKQTWSSLFGKALAVTAANSEALFIPGSVLSSGAGSIEMLIYLLRAPGTTEQTVFDGAGPANQNLQVVVTTAGKLALRYGTGATTVEMVSTETIRDGEVYWVGLGWDGTGAALYLNGREEASSTQPPSLSFGASVCVGAKADRSCQLDGLLDSLRVSSRRRTAAEFSAAYNLQEPLSWDMDTSYLLQFDENLNLPAERQGVWVSPVQNASSATDYSSLTVTWKETAPTNTALSCQVRTSANGVSWSAWYDQVNGESSGAPANPYSQVRFIFQTLNGVDTPVLHEAMTFYEGAPTMTAIATGLGVAHAYSFAQFLDALCISNGVNTPKKYNGASVADIAAAPQFYLMAVWRNRVFGAKTSTHKSRVYMSDLFSIDDWPAVNFLDVNPNDGDEIMALLPGATAFLIVKRHRTYYLQGYSPEDFSISPAGEGGTISPWGAIWTPRGIFLLDRDGVWATDFRKRSRITTDIEGIWKDLDERNLHKAALFYWDDRLLVAVPHKALGKIVCVFDMRTRDVRPWTVWTGWAPQCFVTFYERGRWVCLFGGDSAGNIFEVGESDTDSGAGFTAKIETAHTPLVAEDWLCRLKWCDITFGGGGTDGSCNVAIVTDGQAGPEQTVAVPGGAEAEVVRLFPPPWGRTVGVRVEWPNATARGPILLGVSLTYYPRAPRPERVF